MSPAHSAHLQQQQQYSTGQLSESLPSSQVNLKALSVGISASLTHNFFINISQRHLRNYPYTRTPVNSF